MKQWARSTLSPIPFHRSGTCVVAPDERQSVSGYCGRDECASQKTRVSMQKELCMAAKRRTSWLTEEIADFLASCPSREQLLSYHASEPIQERARELLQKSKSGRLAADEQWELDQFEHTEMLMQLIKARVRAPKVVRS